MDKEKYFERERMFEWGKRMTLLNNEALEIISKIKEEKKKLNENWSGNANNGFNTVMDTLILEAEKSHTDMKEVENTLKEIVTVYDKQ